MLSVKQGLSRQLSAMTCNNCVNIHGCKDARVAYVCDSFEYTALLASREALTQIVGENVAIKTLKKVKPMPSPTPQHTADIIELVNTGNVEKTVLLIGLDLMQNLK